ncbi:MAG: nitroreductase family protein [Candidatus Dormibacterales bacterium]
MEFQDLLARRRMVRRFVDEDLPAGTVERIARAAARAPSAGFSQGQRLVAVTTPALKRRVAAAVGEREHDGGPFGAWVGRCGAQFVPCVSERLYHERYRQPDKVLPDGSEIEWPVPFWWMDVGCTVMLVLLAAVEEGLAAGFAGPGEGLAPLREALGIPDDHAPVGVIPVGRPLPDARSPSLRRGKVAEADYLHLNGW